MLRISNVNASLGVNLCAVKNVLIRSDGGTATSDEEVDAQCGLTKDINQKNSNSSWFQKYEVINNSSNNSNTGIKGNDSDNGNADNDINSVMLSQNRVIMALNFQKIISALTVKIVLTCVDSVQLVSQNLSKSKESISNAQIVAVGSADGQILLLNTRTLKYRRFQVGQCPISRVELIIRNYNRAHSNSQVGDESKFSVFLIASLASGHFVVLNICRLSDDLSDVGESIARRSQQLHTSNSKDNLQQSQQQRYYTMISDQFKNGIYCSKLHQPARMKSGRLDLENNADRLTDHVFDPSIDAEDQYDGGNSTLTGDQQQSAPQKYNCGLTSFSVSPDHSKVAITTTSGHCFLFKDFNYLLEKMSSTSGGNIKSAKSNKSLRDSTDGGGGGGSSSSRSNLIRLSDTYQTMYGSALCSAWSNDSRLLSFGGQDDLIYVIDSHTSEYLYKLDGHQNYVNQILFLKSVQYDKYLRQGTAQNSSDIFPQCLWPADQVVVQSAEVSSSSQDWTLQQGDTQATKCANAESNRLSGNHILVSVGEDCRLCVWNNIHLQEEQYQGREQRRRSTLNRSMLRSSSAAGTATHLGEQNNDISPSREVEQQQRSTSSSRASDYDNELTTLPSQKLNGDSDAESKKSRKSYLNRSLRSLSRLSNKILAKPQQQLKAIDFSSKYLLQSENDARLNSVVVHAYPFSQKSPSGGSGNENAIPSVSLDIRTLQSSQAINIHKTPCSDLCMSDDCFITSSRGGYISKLDISLKKLQ
ncbi:hypothetical protein MIR68_011851 [Amoeboaphelidium protococcarum]|nr:hypothetical protein MIR68_011851 [Amoeboaphelidium protococcarum]